MQHPHNSNLNGTESQKIRNYVIDLLGNDPVNCYRDIICKTNFTSLRSIAKELGISRSTLKWYIANWLETLYRKEKVDEIFKLFWPANSSRQKEKIIFYRIIEKYIRLYPKCISLIPTRNSLLKNELNGIITKNTFKPWVIDYLVQDKFYNFDKSHKIYEEIWGNKCAIKKKIEYNNINNYIHHRSRGRARILTSKPNFDLMIEYPTERYLKLICGEGHKFSIQVRKLIYDYNWCPYCNELICEKIMRSYLEQIFKKEFKVQVSLEKACGIDRKKSITRIVQLNGVEYPIKVYVGQLRYDHFCGDVTIASDDGTIYQFVIAGEYDGFYHDETNINKNPFCDNLENFAAIIARDTIKNEVSYLNKVILIRLKEKKGFTRRKLLKNQKSVIQEIASQINEQIKKLFGFNDVKIRYNPYIKFELLGNDDSQPNKSSLDDYL